MKKLWIEPHLEVLDVNMTMKWHGHGQGNDDGSDENEGGDMLGS